MEKRKLIEMGTLSRGRSQHRPRNDSKLYGGKYPFIQTGDVKNSNLYIEKYSQTYNDFGLNQSKLWPENTLCITIAANIADTGILSFPACFPDSIIGFTATKGKTDVRYVKYCFDLLQKSIQNMSKGSTQDNLSMEKLEQLEFNCPSFESQQKISAVLSSLDDKIALNNRINAKLEQMAKRLYDYWFVQFDFPVSCHSELVSESHSEEMLNQVQHDECIKPYKASGGKMVWNEELKREIPAGWEVKKLGELFTTNRGVSYSTKTITGDIGIPMINLASFSPDGSYKIDGIKIYTGEYTEEKVLKPFDLVMCNTQQTAIDFSKDIIGKALLVPDIFEGDITSSHHVNTLKVHNEKLKFYLYRLFNTDYFHAYISHFASGTNIMGLDFAGVENYTAVIPGDEILSKFADFTLNIEKKKSEIVRENKKLISLRDRLLPLLMNGQVEVN